MKANKIELTIENLKEHLLVITSEINERNSKLDGINSLISSANDKLKTLDKQFEVKAVELLDIEEKKRGIELKEKTILERESALNLRQTEFDKEETARLSELAKEESKLKEAISVHEHELNVSKVNLEAFNAMIEVERSRLTDAIRLLTEEEKSIRESVAKITSTLKTRKDELDSLNMNIERASTELQKLEEEAIAASVESRIKERIDAVVDREEKIEAREKNFLILKSRLSKALEKLYPGQNIDNLV
jgi:chromosome segregation ATPase